MSITWQNRKVLEFPMQKREWEKPLTPKDVTRLDREHEETTSKLWRLIEWYALGCLAVVVIWKLWSGN